MQTSGSPNPCVPTGSARPELEESVPQPALMLGKCSSLGLSPPPHLPLISRERYCCFQGNKISRSGGHSCPMSPQVPTICVSPVSWKGQSFWQMGF